jgi:plastin-1
MKSFKDPCLSTSHFFLDLIDAIKPGVVCFPLVITDAKNEEGNKLNANYAISLARKLGATIFLSSDDIVNVRPKMVLIINGRFLPL